MEQLKEVKIVFGDYNTESFALANAKISNVNLYKKTNRLELFLQSDELIPVSELEKFETYAKKRFNFKEVNFKITLPEIDPEEEIKKDWSDILLFLSKKVPVIKAFLKNSKIEIDNNNINIHLSLKGQVLLEKQGIDKYIKDFIKDIYGKVYTINFVEENVEKTLSNFKEEKKNLIKEFSENSAKIIAFNKEHSVNVDENGENQTAKKEWNNREWK